MKNMNTLISSALLLFVFIGTSKAQTAEASMGTTLPRLSTVSAPAVAAPGKEVTIAFRSFCERPVAIFAGPKEGIREPRIQTFGGLSNYQKLYLRENEVVCLMLPDKRPSACTIIKPGFTTVEVNASANAISSR
jgi:hypothetical protein